MLREAHGEGLGPTGHYVSQEESFPHGPRVHARYVPAEPEQLPADTY